MLNTCIVCGKDFESSRSAKYCTQKCYYKGTYKLQQVEHICEFCGKQYVSSRKQSRFCSVTCREKNRRREIAGVKVCRVCGKPLGKMTQQKYCGRECMKKWRAEHPHWTKTCPACGNGFKTNAKDQVYCRRECADRSKPKCHRGYAVCKQCNKTYLIEHHDTRGKFCSKECYFAWKRVRAEAAKARRAMERVARLQVYADAKQAAAIVRLTSTCRQCGKVFLGHRAGLRYCSDDCRRRYSNHYREASRRSKLRENGRVDHSISIQRLSERDGVRCHICGGKMRLKGNRNHDNAPSIDHLIPVSMGGTHTWDNVKLAHRKCNSAKGNNLFMTRPDGQIVMAIV